MRFIHFALFDGTLLSLHYYLVDTAVCLAFGFLGFRLTRVRQMVTQYGWINERARPPALAPPRRSAAAERQNPGDICRFAA